jgi:hypothetical protein
VIYRWKCISTYPRSPRSWYQTKDLNLGLPPRISTSWHLANGHYSWHITKSHSLGISPRVSPSWYLTKSTWISTSHQDPQLGLSPSDFHLKWIQNLICPSPQPNEAQAFVVPCCSSSSISDDLKPLHQFSVSTTLKLKLSRVDQSPLMMVSMKFESELPLNHYYKSIHPPQLCLPT